MMSLNCTSPVLKNTNTCLLLVCLLTTVTVAPVYASELPNETDRANAVKKSLSRLIEFKNASPKFSFKYPADWTEGSKDKTLPPPFVLKVGALKGAVNVGITVESVPAEMSLEQFAKATLTGIEEVFKANSLKFTIVSQSNVDINGTPSCQVVLLNQMANLTAKQMMLLSISEGQGVCITCSTAEDWYPQYESLFQAMINSTRFGAKK